METLLRPEASDRVVHNPEHNQHNQHSTAYFDMFFLPSSLLLQRGVDPSSYREKGELRDLLKKAAGSAAAGADYNPPPFSPGDAGQAGGQAAGQAGGQAGGSSPKATAQAAVPVGAEEFVSYDRGNASTT